MTRMGFLPGRQHSLAATTFFLLLEDDLLEKDEIWVRVSILEFFVRTTAFVAFVAFSQPGRPYPTPSPAL
jgi:hypothetical protein